MAVTRTARGTAQSKTSGTTLATATQSLNVRDLLVVYLAYDDQTLDSVVWGTQTMTLGDSVLGNGVRVRLAWCEADATASRVITATWAAALVAKAIVADSFRSSVTTSGFVWNPDTNATDVGLGTAASTPATAAITGGTESVRVGVVGTEGPSGDAAGTFVEPNTLGQRIGTTGSSAASNVTVSNAYRLAPTAASTDGLSKTGMTSRDWGAGIRSFYWATPPAAPQLVTPITTAVVTSTFAPTVTVASPPPAGSTHAADNFTRSVTDGWGSADTGGAWTLPGSAADFDVDGSEGTIVLAAAANRNATLNSVAATGDLDVTVDWGFSGTAGGSTVFGWIGLRRQEATTAVTGTLYDVRWQIATSGILQIQHHRFVATVGTFIGSTVNTALTFDNTKRYRLRTLIETSGTTVRIRSKLWEVGTSEPASWQKDDSEDPANAYLEGSSAGTITLRAQSGATSSAGTVYYDNFSVAGPASGTTVTPTTASLTSATFAPTVTATNPIAVTPAVAALTTSNFAPTVTTSNHKSVTPATASLSTSSFAPSVAATQHFTVTPTTASLATSLLAPSVTATAHQTVTPTTANLATSSFGPTVTATTGSGVTVTPTTASLSTARFAPTVATTAHQTVTPTTAALTATRFAPSAIATAHQTVMPSTASLSTARFAPAVSVSSAQAVVPATASLSIATSAPTVTAIAHQTVTPTTASLSTARFAPTVSATAHQTVTPTTAALTTARFAPAATTTAHVSVVPSTASLTTARFAPAVSATVHQSVVPSPASLSLATFIPFVQVGDAQSIVPGAATLSLTTFAPTITAPNPITVTPAVASLTLTRLAPTVLAGVSAVPATASLTTSRFAPTIATTQHRLLVPGVAALAVTPFAPTIAATAHKLVIPSYAAMFATMYAPSVVLATATGSGYGGVIRGISDVQLRGNARGVSTNGSAMDTSPDIIEVK